MMIVLFNAYFFAKNIVSDIILFNKKGGMFMIRTDTVSAESQNTSTENFRIFFSAKSLRFSSRSSITTFMIWGVRAVQSDSIMSIFTVR